MDLEELVKNALRSRPQNLQDGRAGHRELSIAMARMGCNIPVSVWGTENSSNRSRCFTVVYYVNSWDVHGTANSNASQPLRTGDVVFLSCMPIDVSCPELSSKSYLKTGVLRSVAGTLIQPDGWCRAVVHHIEGPVIDQEPFVPIDSPEITLECFASTTESRADASSPYVSATGTLPAMCLSRYVPIEFWTRSQYGPLEFGKDAKLAFVTRITNCRDTLQGLEKIQESKSIQAFPKAICMLPSTVSTSVR